MSITDPIRRAVRAAGSPMRNFFNSHFEMTKEEIRRSTEHLARTGDSRVDQETAQQLAELSNVIAESQLHHARIVAQLRQEVQQLRAEVAELTGASREVSAVVASSTLLPLVSDDTAAASGHAAADAAADAPADAPA